MPLSADYLYLIAGCSFVLAAYLARMADPHSTPALTKLGD